MWGHYTDSLRGYCIEYDIQKILTACSEKCADVQHCTSLMMSHAHAPVIYEEVRSEASQIILPLLLSRMADLAHTAIKPFFGNCKEPAYKIVGLELRIRMANDFYVTGSYAFLPNL